MKEWLNIAKHMREKHPNAKHFGDSVILDKTGKILSQKCQLCGEELIGEQNARKT